MPDINVNYLSEAINDKMGRDMNNREETAPAQVIDTYVNGESGYRIWSDGYCHQWGQALGDGVTVSLLKTLKDTNYHINLGGGNSTGWGVAPHSFTFYNITASSFQIRMEEASGLAGGMNCNWDTYGYLAEGEY